MHSLAVQGNVRRYLAADAPKMRMRMFTDLIGLAKGDVLDGQEGEELVDEVEVEEELESEEELDSETGAGAGGAGGANEGAADSAPSGAGARQGRCSRRTRDSWVEDGAHDEDEDPDFPRLAFDVEMVVDLHDQDWIHNVKKLL